MNRRYVGGIPPVNRNLGPLADRWRANDEGLFTAQGWLLAEVRKVEALEFKLRQMESGFIALTIDAAATVNPIDVLVMGTYESERQRQETVTDVYEVDSTTGMTPGAQTFFTVGYLKGHGFDTYFVRAKAGHAGDVIIRWGYRVHNACGCADPNPHGGGGGGFGVPVVPPGGGGH
jgi:hypothetical protein